MSLLEQDFGSESEDDNFNPAPAGDSDNDAAGESEDEANIKTKANGVQRWRRPSEQEIDSEAQKSTGENGIKDMDGLAEEDEEESGDGDDDEEEDEEDAISV